MHRPTFIITQQTVADRTGGVVLVAKFRTENEHPGDSHHLDIYSSCTVQFFIDNSSHNQDRCLGRHLTLWIVVGKELLLLLL